ncbi:common central domain of tyrosinase-domain-containing protein [Pisolithus tinctorius]|nr:common central domain of tyrosinase-domain-containing protein [Pisolithus tinctorius]
MATTSHTQGTAPYYYPIVGRKSTGGVYDRIPIEDMQKHHPKQFTLFVLSYAAVQGVPNPSVGTVFPGVELPATSYMEIAGIHGKPYQEYAGDRKTPDEKASDYNANDRKDTLPIPSRFGGYCNHGSVSFTTWHRPYMLLIEQAVGDVADRIAAEIERTNIGERGKWIREAKKLRFPYWDWADPRVAQEGLPPVLYEDQLEVTVAGGKKTTVQNPFSYYTYQGGIPSDFTDLENSTTRQTAYYSKWTRTYRHPPNTPEGGSDINALQQALKAQAVNIRTKVGLLFTFSDGEDPALAYDEFSNSVNESRRETDYRNVGSLEAVHGIIHGTIGGNGHMSDPDYAAFDPIFFFHHSNVDRILALWEWCYRDYWMGDGYVKDDVAYPWTQQRGTYAQVYNEQILPTGARGALYPFRNEKGEYWTSEQTRFLDADSYPKYYSYQGFLGVKVDQKATDDERHAARARIAKFYGFDPQTSVKSRNKGDWSHVTVPKAKDRGLSEILKEIPNFRVFIVLVRLPEHAFNRSYSFELYHDRGSAPQPVGIVTVFARPDHSPCKACAQRRESGSIVRGIIPLPFSLVNDIIVNSGIDRTKATVDTTAADITKNLSGKLLDMTGKVLASAQGGTEAAAVPKEKKASSDVVPVEVTLYTSAVAEKVDDEGHPVYLFDWQPHNALFPNGWKAETKEAL